MVKSLRSILPSKSSTMEIGKAIPMLEYIYAKHFIVIYY